MLNDGTILDSARLPQGAVEGHAVTLSAGSLIDTLRSRPASSSGHPITFSGGSIMDSGGSFAPSQHPESLSRSQQVVEYHPVEVTNPDATDSQVLQGKFQSQ